MKYFSFYLTLNIILCYTGLGASVCYSRIGAVPNMNIENCRTSQPSNNSGVKAEASSYRITDATNQKMCTCYEVLLNASQSQEFNLKDIILYSVAVNTPTLEPNKVSSFYSSLRIKEYHPPDLFLSNSSLLL